MEAWLEWRRWNVPTVGSSKRCAVAHSPSLSGRWQTRPNSAYLAMSRDQISQIWLDEIASASAANGMPRTVADGTLALRSSGSTGSGGEATAAVDEIRLTPRLSIARGSGGGVVRRVVV